MSRILIAAALMALAGLTCLDAAQDAKMVPLKKGDRIVFLGDSITAGATGAKGFITLIRNHMKEKHADLGITIIGAGVSGNKVPDLQRRLQKDVLAKKPTIVVIYIGINDVWHKVGTPKDKYEEGLTDIITKIKAAGARVVLCTPSVIGEKKNGANGKDAQLDEYCAISRKVAKDTKVKLCDLHKSFVDYLKKNNPDDKEKGVLTRDTVHLNAAGNALVAATMLKSLDE